MHFSVLINGAFTLEREGGGEGESTHEFINGRRDKRDSARASKENDFFIAKRGFGVTARVK